MVKISKRKMRKCGCGKQYKTRQTLYVHIKNYHKGITPINTKIKRAGRTSKISKLKKFICDKCGLDYSYLKSLNLHQRNKHRIKKQKKVKRRCGFCNELGHN